MVKNGSSTRLPVLILRGLGWFVLGLLGLVVLALLAARAYLDEPRLTALVNEQVGKRFVGRISASAVRWDLPLALSVRGLSVRDPEGVEVLRVESFDARVVLHSLLTATVRVAPVRIAGASVRLFPPPKDAPATRGPFTLMDAVALRNPPSPKPEPESAQPSAITIQVADAVLASARVEVELENWEITVDDFGLQNGRFTLAKGAVDAGAAVRIERAQLEKKAIGPGEAVEVGPIGLSLEDVGYALDPSTRESSVKLSGLDVSAHGSRMTARGEVHGLPEHVAGELTSEISLALSDPRSRALLPERVRKLGPAGRAEVRVHVQGSISEGEAELKVGGPELAVLALQPVALALRARTHEDTLTIEPLSLTLPEGAGLELRASIEGLPSLLQGSSIRGLAHRAELHVRKLPLRALGGTFVDPTVLPETLTATLAAQGPALHPLESEVELRAALEGLPVSLTQGLARRLDIALDTELAEDHARVSSLIAKGDGLSVDVAGTVPFTPAGKLDARLKLEHERPALALARLGVPVSMRRIEVDGVARGRLASPTASVSFALDGIRTEGLEEASVHGDAEWARGTLVLHRALAEATQGRAVVEGQVRVLDAAGKPLLAPEIDAQARIAQIPLGLLTQGRVTGPVSGDVRLTGTPERYDLRALIDAGELEVSGATIAYSPIRVEGVPSALVLSTLRLTPQGGGAVEVEGKVDVPGKRFSADLRVLDVPGAVARAFAPSAPDLSGTLSAIAHAEGPFDKPTATATVTVPGLGVDGEPIGDIELTAGTDGARVDARLELAGAAGRLDAKGRYVLASDDLDARLVGAELSLARLPGLAGIETRVDGRLGIDLYLKGNPRAPRLFGSVGLRGLTMDDQVIGNGRVEVRVSTDDQARYVVDLLALDALRGHALLASAQGGALPIAGEAELQVQDLDVAGFVPSLQEAGIGASVSARADVAIGRGGHAVTGRLTVGKLEASFDTERLAASRPIVIGFDGETLAVEDLVLEGSSGRLEASGRVGKAVDLRAKGDIQLAFLQPFVPSVSQLTGRMQVDARVFGVRDAPTISGDVKLVRPGVVRLRGGLREVALDALEVSLTETSAHIAVLKGRMGGGQFSAEGDVGLAGLAPDRWNVSLNAEGIPFRSEEVLIEGDLHLRAVGTGRVPRVSGTIAIVRGRYTKQFRLQDFVFVSRNEGEEGGGGEGAPPWLSDLVLDLHAASVGAVDVKVDAQVFKMDAELTADLFIRGTAASPRISGRVATESGNVQFPAAKLSVSQATIDFVPTPASGIRPLVDVTAEGEVTVPSAAGDARPQTYDVTMHIKGPPEAMQLELSSTPSLPQGQVLSLVVVGQIDPSQLFAGRPGEGGSRVASSLVFAGSQLAAPLTRLLERELDRALNLNLELGTQVSSESLRITAAKSWTSRFRIEGGWQRAFAEDATATSARATLFLSNSVFLEGSAQTVTGFYSTSTESLSAGTSGSVELKLRLVGH